MKIAFLTATNINSFNFLKLLYQLNLNNILQKKMQVKEQPHNKSSSSKLNSL